MILAFTGAGISKASGISTFEEKGDLRNKLDRQFAIRHPEEFNSIMSDLKEACEKAEPNDAHIALKEYDIPVITMNIDSLHTKAGSNYIIEVHGSFLNNNVVLYGDPAPKYSDATDLAKCLKAGDILLIIGTSFYTSISKEIKGIAEMNGAEIVVINSNAENEVRKFLEEHQENMEDFEAFIKRSSYYEYLRYLFFS